MELFKLKWNLFTFSFKGLFEDKLTQSVLCWLLNLRFSWFCRCATKLAITSSPVGGGDGGGVGGVGGVDDTDDSLDFSCVLPQTLNIKNINHMTKKGSAMANTGIEKISNVWQELCFKQNVGVSAFIQCVFELTHNPSKDLAKERTPGADGWTLNH